MWQEHTQVKRLNKGLQLFDFEVTIQPDPTLIREANKKNKNKDKKTRLSLMKPTATTPAIQ